MSVVALSSLRRTLLFVLVEDAGTFNVEPCRLDRDRVSAT